MLTLDEPCMAGISLRWDLAPPAPHQSATGQPSAARIPLEHTHLRHDVPNDLGHLLVLPAEPCASRSLVRASGLTLATAGVEASLRILSRDAYENRNEASLEPKVLPHAGIGHLPSALTRWRLPDIVGPAMILLTMDDASPVMYSFTTCR